MDLTDNPNSDIYEKIYTDNLIFQSELLKLQEKIRDWKFENNLDNSYFENTKIFALIAMLDKEIKKWVDNKFLFFSSNITEWITKEEKKENQIEEEEIWSVFSEFKKIYKNKWFDVIFIDWKVSKEQRKKIMNQERENPDKKTMIFATWETVWEWVDMTFSCKTYKLNPSWTETAEEQIWWRTHRPWQLKEVDYFRLLVWNLDIWISRYARWKYRKIKLVLDWEAQSEEDLNLINWDNKKKVLEKFL